MFPVHNLSTSSVFVSAFSQIARAAAAFSFFACAFISSLSAFAAVFCGGGFSIFRGSLGFFRAKASQLQCFFCLVALLMLKHVVFSSSILIMVVRSKHGDRESCDDTSVVTSPMWIMSLASASSLGLKYLLLVSM